VRKIIKEVRLKYSSRHSSKRNNSHLIRFNIPKDLEDKFEGRTRFHISLKNVKNKERHLVSIYLKSLTSNLFKDIRMGMKKLSVEDIREILKVEVRKSILHSHHTNLEVNKYDSEEIQKSLTKVSSKEEKMRQKLKEDLKTYEGMLDEKLEKILLSLDIEFDNKTVDYKQLRRHFIDLYLLRFEFIRNLINETGRTDDDFKREVEEKLKVELFSESKEKSTPDIQNFSVEQTLDSHQSTPLSVGIKDFIDEKLSLRDKSIDEINNSLKLMIEDWGDIPIGSVTREMSTNFKCHIRKLPRNRNKLPEYRDKSFHEQVQMEVKDTISNTTINKHLGWCSSFYKWSINHGYSNINPFEGLKLKRTVKPEDERDTFSDQELKKIFQKDNYIHFSNVEKGRYELYWVPLIGVFTGCRLREITELYLDDIKMSGGHRKKRWVFDINENKPDKHLKNLPSRRIVPVHETLIELGLIQFIELLKKKDPNRKKVFEELNDSNTQSNVWRNVSRWFNSRYLPSLGVKTKKNDFHSFRHTVIDHLKQKGIEINFINKLVGQSTGNISVERYGNGYNPDIIFNKCVKRISYQTSQTRWINFKNLKVDWTSLIT